MIIRLLLTAGVFMFGYFVGREIGKTDHIRKSLAEQRANKPSPTRLKSNQSGSQRQEQSKHQQNK